MIRCRPTILFVLARSKFSRTTETHWKHLHAIMLLIIFIGCSHKKKTETKWVFYVNFNDRARQRPSALDGFPPTPISPYNNSKRSSFPDTCRSFMVRLQWRGLRCGLPRDLLFEENSGNVRALNWKAASHEISKNCWQWAALLNRIDGPATLLSWEPTF